MLKKNENKGQVIETQTAEISLQKKPRPVLKKTKKLLQSSMLAFSIATAALPQVSCTVDQLEAFLATTAVFSLVLAASSVDVSVSWDSHCHPSTPDYPYDSQYFYSSKIQEAVDSMSYREKKYFEAYLPRNTEFYIRPYVKNNVQVERYGRTSRMYLDDDLFYRSSSSSLRSALLKGVDLLSKEYSNGRSLGSVETASVLQEKSR